MLKFGLSHPFSFERNSYYYCVMMHRAAKMTVTAFVLLENIFLLLF